VSAKNSKPTKNKPAGAKPARPSSARSQPAPKRYSYNPLTQPMRRPPAAQAAPAAARPAALDVEPERIDLVDISLIEPDFWQGRRPLPPSIRARFRDGEIAAEAAVREWVRVAETDPAARSRLEEYRTLARSLAAHEQINPSSVVRIPLNARGARYRIESGERRYWATLLNIVEGRDTDRMLKVVIRETFSARRQAEENSTQMALGAVELARTAARTLLEQMKITPETAPIKNLTPGSDEFYRLALEPAEKLLGPGHDRLPRGIWPVVEETMGRQRPMLEKLMRVLSLPDDVLELADAFCLPERVLRVVLAAGISAERQRQVVLAAGQWRLGNLHVQQLCVAADFAAELDRIKHEIDADESEEDGMRGTGPTKGAGKPRRSTPAKRSLGAQFADRLGNLRKTVVGLAKGQGISEADAVGSLVGEALHVKPTEAQNWLDILLPLVEHLRKLSNQADQHPE
jgi:hypothetical protein